MLKDKKKMKRKFLLTVIVLFLLAALYIFGILVGKGVFSENKAPAITSDLIANGIAEISEYAVLDYHYTNVGKFEDQKDFYGWKVPLTTKSFIITYDGSMKIGIRGETKIEVKEKNIHITLSPASVLSHVIDESSIEVLDQTKNAFNQIEVEDYANFAIDQKKVMEEKAISNGLMKETEEIAKTRFTNFIQGLPGMEEYTLIIDIQKGD